MGKMSASNDNEAVTPGSGNVFTDLGFDAGDAARAIDALREYTKRGGVSFAEFKAELGAHSEALILDLVPRVYDITTKAK